MVDVCFNQRQDTTFQSLFSILAIGLVPSDEEPVVFCQMGFLDTADVNAMLP